MKPYPAAAAFAIAFAFALFLSSSVPAHAETPAQRRQQAERVVEKFRMAIANKDKDSFMKLFLREDITWVAALDDASLARIKARRADKSLPGPKKNRQRLAARVHRRYRPGFGTAPGNLRQRPHRCRRRRRPGLVRLQFQGRGLPRELGQGRLAPGAHGRRLEDRVGDLVDDAQSGAAAIGGGQVGLLWRPARSKRARLKMAMGPTWAPLPPSPPR